MYTKNYTPILSKLTCTKKLHPTIIKVNMYNKKLHPAIIKVNRMVV